MRVGKSAAAVAGLRLDAVAKASAEAIHATGNPAIGIPRFLIRLADHLQSRAARDGGDGLAPLAPLDYNPDHPRSRRRRPD